jgi:hypothetical protein
VLPKTHNCTSSITVAERVMMHRRRSSSSSLNLITPRNSAGVCCDSPTLSRYNIFKSPIRAMAVDNGLQEAIFSGALSARTLNTYVCYYISFLFLFPSSELFTLVDVPALPRCSSFASMFQLCLGGELKVLYKTRMSICKPGQLQNRLKSSDCLASIDPSIQRYNQRTSCF